MSEYEQLQKTFNAFNDNPCQKVLAIKGDWGVGKTYAWHKIVESSDIGKKFVYLSLFGIKNSEDIKKQLASRLLINTGKNNKKTFKRIGAGAIKLFSKGDKILQLTSSIYDLYLENFILKDAIICLDDLERISSSISLIEVLGIASELASEKNCKIVLIYNDQQIKQKEDSENYFEKTVDIAVRYQPDIAENASNIFKELKEKDEKLVILEEHQENLIDITKTLNLYNGRTIVKLYGFLFEIFSRIPEINKDTQKRIVEVLACAVKYGIEKNSAVTLDIFNEYLSDGPYKKAPSDSMIRQLNNRAKELTKDEMQQKLEHEKHLPILESLSSIIKYNTVSRPLDLMLTQYVRDGFIDDSSLKKEITHFEKENQNYIESSEVLNKLFMYQIELEIDFDANEDEILKKLADLLQSDWELLSLYHRMYLIKILIQKQTFQPEIDSVITEMKNSIKSVEEAKQLQKELYSLKAHNQFKTKNDLLDDLNEHCRDIYNKEREKLSINELLSSLTDGVITIDDRFSNISTEELKDFFKQSDKVTLYRIINGISESLCSNNNDIQILKNKMIEALDSIIDEADENQKPRSQHIVDNIKNILKI